jgi:hypothetical protein
MTETHGLAVHESLESISDPSDLLDFTGRFLSGDCGELADEDEVLGFLRRALDGRVRHAFYDTQELGRIHVVGNEEQLYVMPDSFYVKEMQGFACSINTCTCGSTYSQQPTNQ